MQAFKLLFKEFFLLLYILILSALTRLRSVCEEKIAKYILYTRCPGLKIIAFKISFFYCSDLLRFQEIILILVM